MSIPKEPRQRMINMMYLVLTALLALNVSSEILNAFKTVNNSLQNTNTTVNNSTQTILSSLSAKVTEPATAEKAKLWNPKALDIQKKSTDVFNFIQTLKDRIITDANGDPKDPTKKFKEDNLDIATHIMVEKGEGKKLYDMLANYKKAVLDVDPLIKKEFEKTLQIDLTQPKTESKANNSWEAAYFRMVPTVAALTILSKFQNDIRTSENKLVAFCHEQVGKVEVRFDAYEAIVGQNSKYLMPGEEIEITAGLGAFSKTKLPTVSIGGSNISLNDKGIAMYKTAAGAIGKHTINVTVAFTNVDGKPDSRTIPVEYTVGQANASIALDEMNVLYAGYENKISIAASGGGDDKIQATISGGGGSLIRQGNGKWIAKVNTVTDDCKITVTVDGKVAGISQFRVRTIPQPVGTVGGYASGDNVNAGAFKAQTGVGAYIKDFPLNLKYSVTKFTLTADNADGDIIEENCVGNTWTPKALNMIKGLTSGRTVTIDNLYATGPDGRSQHLPSLVYYIK